MVNSLAPAFFRLFETTAQSIHVRTVPTLAWNPGGSFGTFLTWNAGTIDGDDAINDYIAKLLPFMISTTSINSAIIYTQADAESPARPRAAFDIVGATGTSSDPAQPASQGLYIFRTDAFGLSKVTFLDQPVTTNFLPITSMPGSGALPDLFVLLKDGDHPYAGRDNGRINTFVKATFKLNDKLRDEYRYD